MRVFYEKAGADEAGDEVVSAWGQYLNSFAWAHAATLTPRFVDTPPGKLEASFHNKFIRALALAAQRPVPWFYVMERSNGGVLHMHALLANTEALTIAEMRRAWPLGISQIKRYSAVRAGAWYAAKSLGLSNDRWERWDLSRRMPERRAL